MSNSLSHFHSSASFTFTPALSLSTEAISPNMSGQPESPSHPYSQNLPLLCLLFASLLGSTSPLLLNFIYTDLRPLWVISWLSAVDYLFSAPNCKADVSNQHRAFLIIKLDKWDSASVFFVIIGCDSNNVSWNNLVREPLCMLFFSRSTSGSPQSQRMQTMSSFRLGLES